MRLVVTEYLSLDGFFHEPGEWSGPFFNDEAAEYKWAELQAADAMLLGRKTYEGFAAAWPTMRDTTGAFGAKMNDMPKYVVSSTLSAATWSGSRLIRSNVLDEVRRLKAASGHDLLLAGSGQLFNMLCRENLVDRFRFMVHPVLLGQGKRLFDEGRNMTPLALIDSKTFRSGIVVLEYEPVTR
jgi:dihydrofolate reductase